MGSGICLSFISNAEDVFKLSKYTKSCAHLSKEIQTKQFDKLMVVQGAIPTILATAVPQSTGHLVSLNGRKCLEDELQARRSKEF
ncbi:hypothetical protein ACTXT7_014039 [Hymenolepis weldensis]